jgi:hypothetical protein
MSQTRLESAIEAVINVLIGFGVALASQLAIFPLVGIHGVPWSTNLEVGAWFTLVSLVRSYVIRRWCNARLRQVVHAIAGLLR